MRCGPVLLWLVLARALKLTADPLAPLAVFQRFALADDLLGILLHSLQVKSADRFPALARLLGHSRLPFRHVYEASCGRHLSRTRLNELVSAILHQERRDLTGRVLSLGCVQRSGVALTQPVLDFLGPGYLIDGINERRTVVGTSVHSLYRQVDQCAFRADQLAPSLLQSSVLFRDDSVSREFWQQPASSYLGENGWQAFFYGCFNPAVPKNPHAYLNASTLQYAVRWLLADKPVGLLFAGGTKVQSLAHWATHLCLVLLEIGDYYERTGGYIAGPVYEYLGRFAGLLKDTQSDGFQLIQALILGVSTFWHNRMVLPAWQAPTKQGIELPPIRQLLDLVLANVMDKSRWILAVADLYASVDAGWLGDAELRRVLSGALERATDIEVAHWVQRYLRLPKDYRFLAPRLARIVRSRAALQEFVVESTETTSDVGQLFVLAAVPLSMRLKYARAVLLADRRLAVFSRLAWRTQLPESQADSPNLARLVHQYFEQAGALQGADPDTLLLRFDEMQDTERLIFSLSVAAMFGTGLPAQVGEAELRALLGLPPGPGAWPDGECIAGSRLGLDKVIPPIFTWQEVYGLLTRPR